MIQMPTTAKCVEPASLATNNALVIYHQVGYSEDYLDSRKYFMRINFWIPLCWVSVLMVGMDPVWAQLRLVPEASRQVYQDIPELPLENSYAATQVDSGSSEENTLVRRIMIYHLQVKGRSPTNRLDWKLTLADYLDVNEPMYAQAYPGAANLSSNPYAPDRAIIQSLSREQRNQLLKALIVSFGGDPTPAKLYIPPLPSPTPSTKQEPDKKLTIPEAGAADLLK